MTSKKPIIISDTELTIIKPSTKSKKLYNTKSITSTQKKIVRPKSKCEHGRRQYVCKECHGNGICEHNRRKAECKECHGSGICEHSRRKAECKDCGGSSICEHSRVKSKCKECHKCKLVQLVPNYNLTKKRKLDDNMLLPIKKRKRL